MPPRRKKSNKGQDYISNLPDFVIGHILSFLSTTDAVCTTALSKRWKYMWTFVTKLDFCDGKKTHDYRIKQFPNFVSRVLSHINSASIQKFDLCIGDYYGDRINQWLCVVLNKGVKNIYLASYGFYLSCYPLFQSPSLEGLFIRTMIFNLYSIIKVPTFISLPSLTVVSLTHITVTHDSSVKELTLKLPLLRSFRTENCTWLDIERVTFEAPLLEYVTIMEMVWTSSTTQSKSQTEIKFCASHLNMLFYRGYISQMQTFLVDGPIASADISLTPLESSSVEETSLFVWKLLSLFTNTKCLVLCFDRLQFIVQVKHHLAGDFAFQMLDDMRLTSATGEVLLSLLLKSPCLKTLVLQVNAFDKGVQNFAIVPDCFLSTLKVVKFEIFLGGVCELSFAKFVMENTLVLERISFLFHEKLTCSEVEKVKEKLLLFKKSSSTVIMEFSPPISVEHKKVEKRPNSHAEMSQAGPSRSRRQLAKPSWMNDYVCNV